MKLNDFYKIADELAPKALSDEYCKRWNAYDNSGVLVNTGDDINAAIFSLDLSQEVVDKAIAYNVKLIVTHHPAIYSGQRNVCADAFQPLGEKLIKCIKHGISVVSMHLNLDCAENGIDDCLKDGIVQASGAQETAETVVMHPLSVGGYGKAYSVKENTLEAFAKKVGEVFSTNRVLVYGDLQKPIRRVASFCGSGADEGAVEFAVANGADVIVSSDFKHHVLTLANEKHIAVLALTHYASEQYGFKKYYEKIRQLVSIPCLYHTDEELL